MEEPSSNPSVGQVLHVLEAGGAHADAVERDGWLRLLASSGASYGALRRPVANAGHKSAFPRGWRA